MQIVIDIPEDVRVAISRMGLLSVPDEMQKIVDKAIQHGTPQPKTHPKMGRWIIVDDCEHFFIAKCSECGRIEDSRLINNYPYCHCGAKMDVNADGDGELNG